MTSWGAIVLCGGLSSRMGTSKAWLLFDGEPMLARVVRRLAEAIEGGPIVVVRAEGQELPPLPFPVTVVSDPFPQQGPLRGIATGLEALPEETDLAYVSATDVPFLRPEWARRLLGLANGFDVVWPFVEGRHHPLAAVYRRATALPAALGLLEQGRMRPLFLGETLRAREVPEEDLRRVDPELSTLQNLNAPEDLQAAIERLNAPRSQ